MFVSAAKARLHRAIVADPVLHGHVLNLYLNGEEYPRRVESYFPFAAAEDAGLGQRMREHLREEDKHVALYRRAIARLGQPVTELPPQEIYNAVILKHTPPLDTSGLAPRDALRLGLAHFLAHLHFLEARVARSLGYHVEACAIAADSYAFKAVGAVLHDEHGHVAYTREAVEALLPRRVAEQVLEAHRAAERRANREFSSVQLQRLVCQHRARLTPTQRVFIRGWQALSPGRHHA